MNEGAEQLDAFSLRSARSPALLAGLALVIGAEAAVLHLWLSARHPIVAWSLTVSSAAALAWLIGDHRALGRARVLLHDDWIDLRIGWRVSGRIDRRTLSDASRPTWRDLPTPGTPAAEGFVNLTKPADPNVLLRLDVPARLRIAGGIARHASRIAMHLDEPDRFIDALRSGGA